jgi:hypothetical protein
MRISVAHEFNEVRATTCTHHHNGCVFVSGN